MYDLLSLFKMDEASNVVSNLWPSNLLWHVAGGVICGSVEKCTSNATL